MSDERRLLARAQEANDTTDIAGMTVAILAGARLARLDPDALRGLVGTAWTLGATQLQVYTAGSNGEPEITTERAFLILVAGVEDDIDDRLDDAKRLRREARAVRARGRRDLDTAWGELARACDIPAGLERWRARAIAAARRKIRDATDRITFSQAALDVLVPLIRRLEHARSRIRAVPADLGETYETVYWLIRRGHQMPYDGDWISGEGRVS